jgi:hypothetical protein
MKSIIALFPAIAFLGCMHAGMSMMGGGDQVPVDPVLQKEVISGSIKAVATFPPLETEQEVLLTLRLFDLHTSQPISGAGVYFHAEYTQPTDSSGNDVAPQHAARLHDKNIIRDLQESEEPGTYSVSYSASQAGQQELMFHVTSIGGQKLEPEIVIDAKRRIVDHSTSHHGGMMGSSSSTYLLIGGVMAAAMLAFMFIHGGMF